MNLRAQTLKNLSCSIQSPHKHSLPGGCAVAGLHFTSSTRLQNNLVVSYISSAPGHTGAARTGANEADSVAPSDKST